MKGPTTIPILLLTTLACLDNIIATVTTDSQQVMPCNTCCQGPVGSQGTPGIPGTHGMPGNAGPKGERGEGVRGDAGLHGEKGEIGSPGSKGASGKIGLRGPPGKVGPARIARPIGSLPAGIAGSADTPGVKGQKGEIGQSGLSGTPGVKGQKGEMGHSRLSAFSAVRSSSFTPTIASQALPFTRAHTNIGDDFHLASGRFTCEIPGIYLFTYHIMTNRDAVSVKLMKNTVLINTAFRENESLYDIVSNTAVLQLAAGDQVWLKCLNAGRQIYSDGALMTTFSGVILHEI